MRLIRYSRSFYDSFATLLEQGIDRVGAQVVAERRDLVYRCIEQFLVRHPRREPDPELGIWAYHVSRTPVVLVYDSDDSELRLHLVIHASADRSQVDLATVEW